MDLNEEGIKIYIELIQPEKGSSGRFLWKWSRTFCPPNAGNFLTTCATITFLRSALLLEVGVLEVMVTSEMHARVFLSIKMTQHKSEYKITEYWKISCYR
jgi:hypothetical protein